MPRYYYNQDAGKCKEFTWGGCGGVVPFVTMPECKSACE
ncbi:MAG: BPTI/Kunitz domain-containing protein [Candidatus Marinimicrobia bacterium]|nr:BPTI/Kunitz domain-containing protein [Candidatus Neomarinimicrobiota bacterium]